MSSTFGKNPFPSASSPSGGDKRVFSDLTRLMLRQPLQGLFEYFKEDNTLRLRVSKTVGSPRETISDVEYLNDRFIEMRERIFPSSSAMLDLHMPEYRTIVHVFMSALATHKFMSEQSTSWP